MCVGYDPSSDDAELYADLDEYLCEYVDGEMDPAVCAAFEEYLCTNPALAEHVECLRRTRHVLCAFSSRIGAPCGLNARLRRQLSREMMQGQLPLLSAASNRLTLFAGFASVCVLMLMAGIVLAGIDSPERIHSYEVAASTPPPMAKPVLPQWVSLHRTAWQQAPHAADGLAARLALVGSTTGIASTLRPILSDSHQTAYAALAPGLQRAAWTP